jgi:hypothetical protein
MLGELGILLFGIVTKSNKKASPWKFDYPLNERR